MIKHKFDEIFNRFKDYLPTIEIRETVKNILRECDILTQTELQKQVIQLEVLQERIKALEERLKNLENN